MAKKKPADDLSYLDLLNLDQIITPEPEQINVDDLLLMDLLLQTAAKPLEAPEFDPIFLSEMLDKMERDQQATIDAAANADWLDYLFLGMPEEPEPAAADNPSLSDLNVARWMQAEVAKGTLYHATVVSHLWRYFGQRFTRRNKAGNRVVATDVLQELLKLYTEPIFSFSVESLPKTSLIQISLAWAWCKPSFLNPTRPRNTSIVVTWRTETANRILNSS